MTSTTTKQRNDIRNRELTLQLEEDKLAGEQRIAARIRKRKVEKKVIFQSHIFFFNNFHF